MFSVKTYFLHNLNNFLLRERERERDLHGFANKIIIRDLVLVHDMKSKLIFVIFTTRVLSVEHKFLVPYWFLSFPYNFLNTFCYQRNLNVPKKERHMHYSVHAHNKWIM